MADALTAAGTAMFDDVMMAKILVLSLRGRFGMICCVLDFIGS